MLCMTLSSQEKPLFKKRIPFDDTFYYSVRTFVPIRQYYFSKCWGDACMGRPPTSNFLGGQSPSPPRSPPLQFIDFYSIVKSIRPKPNICISQTLSFFNFK